MQFIYLNFTSFSWFHLPTFIMVNLVNAQRCRNRGFFSSEAKKFPRARPCPREFFCRGRKKTEVEAAISLYIARRDPIYIINVPPFFFSHGIKLIKKYTDINIVWTLLRQNRNHIGTGVVYHIERLCPRVRFPEAPNSFLLSRIYS